MEIEERLALVEARLARSEQREARYRRTALASLALVLGVGFLALARPAETDKVGTELKGPVSIVDKDGRTIFEMGSGNGMPYLLMLNDQQELVARIGGSTETGGGFLDLLHSTGREGLKLALDDYGGSVRTFDKKRRPRVTIDGDRHGGRVVLSDTEGSFKGWFHMRERGGVLLLSGNELKNTAYLGPAEDDAGQLILYTPQDQKGNRIAPEKKQ